MTVAMYLYDLDASGAMVAALLRKEGYKATAVKGKRVRTTASQKMVEAAEAKIVGDSDSPARSKRVAKSQRRAQVKEGFRPRSDTFQFGEVRQYETDTHHVFEFRREK